MCIPRSFVVNISNGKENTLSERKHIIQQINIFSVSQKYDLPRCTGSREIGN